MDTKTTTIVKTESGAIVNMTASQPSLFQIESAAELEPMTKRMKVEDRSFVQSTVHVESVIRPLQPSEHGTDGSSAATHISKAPVSSSVIPNCQQQVSQHVSDSDDRADLNVSISQNPNQKDNPDPDTVLPRDISNEKSSKSQSFVSSATVSPTCESQSIMNGSAKASTIPNKSTNVAATTSSVTHSQSTTTNGIQVLSKPSASIEKTSNSADTLSLEMSNSQDIVTFQGLRRKYLGELEYMLIEFQKLERQLLGAKVQNTEESIGSKERREKLHSFIVHLEETMQQIMSGCELENINPSSYLDKDKLDNDSAQKLEDHILANLLPVKVRLKRQLAAQQGAKHNPAGMPTVRGGMQQLQPTHLQGKATFLRQEGPLERRSSTYGKGATEDTASSTVQKNQVHKHIPTHAASMGGSQVVTQSIKREYCEPVNSLREKSTASENMEITSPISPSKTKFHLPNQSVSVSSAHPVFQNNVQSLTGTQNARDNSLKKNSLAPTLIVTTETGRDSHPMAMSNALIPIQKPLPSIPTKQQAVQKSIPARPLHLAAGTVHQPLAVASLPQTPSIPSQKSMPTVAAEQKQITACAIPPVSQQIVVTKVPDEERRRLKRRRKKKKRQSEQLKSHVVCQTGEATSKRSKRTQCQRGPRNVEYTCALCNETYNSTCDYNPWWALTQHDCLKCCKSQVSFNRC
jgi:hypothetical protein